MIEVANQPLSLPPLKGLSAAEVLDTVRTLIEQDVERIFISDDRSGSGGWLMDWEIPA